MGGVLRGLRGVKVSTLCSKVFQVTVPKMDRLRIFPVPFHRLSELNPPSPHKTTDRGFCSSSVF